MSIEARVRRFLQLADESGMWSGMSLVWKGMILRAIHRDPLQAHARLEALAELWARATNEVSDGRRTHPAGGAGGRRLDGAPAPALGADRREAPGAPRADATAGPADAGAHARAAGFAAARARAAEAEAGTGARS